MSEAKLFINGGSQAVRLPKDCRFDPDQKVIIKKIGYMVVMVPEDKINFIVESGYGGASPDFFVEGRIQNQQDERNPL